MKFKFILAVFIALIICGGGSAIYVQKELSPKSNLNTKPMLFQVKPGTTLSQVTVELSSRNLIRNPRISRLYAKARGWDKRIIPGYYLLSSNMDTVTILRIIAEGRIERVQITIPEGYNAKQIGQLLEGYSFSSKKYFDSLKDFATNKRADYQFLNEMNISDNFEGVLFPDTYQVGEKESELVKQQFERFNAVIMPLWRSRPASFKLNLNEALTLASIVEKEAQRPEERRLISGVFTNRLIIGMPLGSDPTVEYALGWHQDAKGLTYNDVKINSPYNTYINRGLPPTPICNPGAEVFKAVLDPETTKYLFFVARGDGSHIFTKTVREHENAKQMLIKLLRKKS